MLPPLSSVAYSDNINKDWNETGRTFAGVVDFRIAAAFRRGQPTY